MDEAVERQIVHGMRLGLRKPDPVRAAKSLRAGDYLTYQQNGLVPPPAVDHFSQVSSWGLYRNDLFGICGPTAAANLRRVLTKYVTGAETDLSQADVDALYALQNPGFDSNTSVPGGPQDNGVDLQLMCDQLIQYGIGGVKALAHAAVDPHNHHELRECVTLFGGILLGVDLEIAQQAQTPAGVWNYDPTSEWGGHAVLFGKYASAPNRIHVITWAMDVAATDSFEDQQLQEARVVIWPENLQLGAFQTGVDLASLAADYKQLTGRDFPVPPTPSGPASKPQPAQSTDVESLTPFAKSVEEATRKLIAEDVLAEGRQLVTQLDSWLKKHGA